MNQKLTKEEAIKLFRQLWTDMQTELGDNPVHTERRVYKSTWCNKHFPVESIMCSCPLCEYAYQRHVAAGYKSDTCRFCPIDWPASDVRGVPDCQGHQMHYLLSHISEILALPEREVPDEDRLQNNKSSDEKGARDDTNETV